MSPEDKTERPAALKFISGSPGVPPLSQPARAGRLSLHNFESAVDTVVCVVISSVRTWTGEEGNVMPGAGEGVAHLHHLDAVCFVRRNGRIGQVGNSHRVERCGCGPELFP
jgi:hypothetical protein